MGRLKLNVQLSVALLGLNIGAVSSIPCSAGIYDMRPKNHDRGGSRGKGGKIKYARR